MLPCTAATRAIWFCTSGAAKERMVLVLKPSLHDAVWCKNGALDLITLFRIDTTSPILHSSSTDVSMKWVPEDLHLYPHDLDIFWYS